MHAGLATHGLLGFTDNPYIILAIVVISAISSWLQNRKKKQNQAERWGGEENADYEPNPQTGGGTTSNSNQPLNWEEELKRLLEGKPPLDGTVGAPPPPPPPIIRRTDPPPVPEPIARESETPPEENYAARESSSPWANEPLDSLPAPTKPLAHLEHNTQAYHRATRLHETISARMRQVSEQTERHGNPITLPQLARKEVVSADLRAVVGLLRQPATARQALLASFVLAPPKALET